MRRRGRNKFAIGRHWLFGTIGLLAFVLVTVNCTFDETVKEEYLAANTLAVEEAEGSAAVEGELAFSAAENDTSVNDDTFILSDELWADVSEAVTTPRSAPSSHDRISLDVHDAYLIDVLSLLAYKLDMNIIYLEENLDRKITIKTEILSPITTFQIVLQKEGLDYLVIGRNYIVGERGRLYDDFTNRMFLTRFDLHYVSANAMEGYINELGMPLQSLAVDSNQRALWMQGTPMTLGKARELINTLDVRENAAFGEGGSRKIRMPVATASGRNAEQELNALIELLSILLDGFRDGRTDIGWVTWDHPDPSLPIPQIYIDWDNPVIKPYDIKMKVTRDFAFGLDDEIRYLIAEGNPDNIELVRQMIATIAGTPASPISFGQPAEEDENDNNNDNDNNIENTNNEAVGGTSSQQWTPTTTQPVAVRSHIVTVKATPAEGGSVSGGGSINEGSSATVNATPAEGYEFVRWMESGAELSKSRSYTFPVYLDRNLEAIFVSTTPPDDKASEEEPENGQ